MSARCGSNKIQCEENNVYAILDDWNARWSTHAHRPELAYGCNPASPLPAFKDPHAVVEAIRTNVSGSDIYTAPQGLFVSVSLHPRLQSFSPRLAGQVVVEFAVALGLCLLVLAAPLRPSMHSAGLLGLAGLIAGIETHFPNWNWAGFPTSYVLAGSAYLAGNWFITGLVLGAVRRKLEAGRDTRGTTPGAR